MKTYKVLSLPTWSMSYFRRAMRNYESITFPRVLATVLCGILVADLVLTGSRAWPLVTGLSVIILSDLAKQIFELTHQEAKLRSGLQKVDLMESDLKDLRGQFKLLKMGYEQGVRK